MSAIQSVQVETKHKSCIPYALAAIMTGIALAALGMGMTRLISAKTLPFLNRKWALGMTIGGVALIDITITAWLLHLPKKETLPKQHKQETSSVISFQEACPASTQQEEAACKASGKNLPPIEVPFAENSYQATLDQLRDKVDLEKNQLFFVKGQSGIILAILLYKGNFYERWTPAKISTSKKPILAFEGPLLKLLEQPYATKESSQYTLLPYADQALEKLGDYIEKHKPASFTLIGPAKRVDYAQYNSKAQAAIWMHPGTSCKFNENEFFLCSSKDELHVLPYCIEKEMGTQTSLLVYFRNCWYYLDKKQEATLFDPNNPESIDAVILKHTEERRRFVLPY